MLRLLELNDINRNILFIVYYSFLNPYIFLRRIVQKTMIDITKYEQ